MTENNENFDINNDFGNNVTIENDLENEETIEHNYCDDDFDTINIISNKKIKLKNLNEILEDNPDNSRLKEIILKNAANKIIDAIIAFHNKNKSKVKDKNVNGSNSILRSKNTQRLNNNYTFIGDNLNEPDKIGFGVQNWNDGSKSIGYFKNFKSNGINKFIDSENNYSLGNFVDDKREGFCIYSYNNGSKYIGEWVNDLQEGIGQEIWKDGSTYQGEFLNGQKNGLGLYTWNDGSKYEGEWKDNNLSGYGIYYFPNGDKIYTGEWKDNVRNGIGELVWINEGRKYIGYFSDDKINGFGLLIWKEPFKIFIGSWLNGKQNGLGKYMDSRKEKYGLWDNGKIVKWFKKKEKIDENIEKDYLIEKFLDKPLKEIKEKLTTIDNI